MSEAIPPIPHLDITIPPPPTPERTKSYGSGCPTPYNPLPQNAPGASAAVGHNIENSIPLSIFPITTDKFCIAFCGLPGRGKTHVSRRLGRYLEFFHAIPVKIFNLTDYRRKMFAGLKREVWHDPYSPEFTPIREVCQKAAIEDLTEYLNSNPNGLAIWDSTSETPEKRQRITEIVKGLGAKMMWIEVSNEDESFLREQYHMNAFGPDYAEMENVDEAEKTYEKRVNYFRKVFVPIDQAFNHPIESKWPYMKCDHSRKHFVIHNVRGYLFQKVVNFIMNLRTTSHSFFLTRHGQSEYNDLGRIGGDSGLTQHGLRYAEKLAEYVENNIVHDKDGKDVPARLWTSTMRRTRETAQFIKQTKIMLKKEDDPSVEYEWVQMRPRAWHHLDELFAGSCDGMTYEEIEEKYPEEWERRSVDKLAYRYPRGESYLDVIARLEPIIIEMERHQETLLIIGHQGILRIIYAFYMGLSRAEAPYVSLPLNTLVELNPGAYTCEEKRYLLYTPPKQLPHDGQTEPKPYNMDPQSH